MNTPGGHTPATPRTPTDEGRVVHLVGAIVAFVGSLALYVKTMAASTSFWDSGEFIAAAKDLGVPHSPGTPLYILVAKIFTLIPLPSLSVAERVNLLSAVCGALGVLFVYLLVARLLSAGTSGPRSRVQAFVAASAALAGAFFLAFSDTYWNNAIEAEVYSMSAALMGLMTWLALKWGDNPRGPRSTFTIYLLFYLLALSVGFHLGTILVFSGVALFVLMTKDKPFSNLEFLVACFGVAIFIADATLYRDGQVTMFLLLVFVAVSVVVSRVRSPFAVVCSALFVLGLSVHLFLMVRSGHNPSIDEGNPETWRSLWAVLRREQYPPMNVLHRKADFLFQLQHFNGYLQAQYQMAAAYVGKMNLGSLLPIGLGVWGIVDHFSRDRKTFVMTFVTLVVVSLGLVVFLNFSNSEVRERDYFYSPAFYYFAVYIGVGAGSLVRELYGFLVRRAFRLAPATYAAAGVLLILPMFTLKQHYFTHDRSRNTVCEEFGRNMLVGLDPDAILFTFGDNDTFPVWYSQEVEGVRRDVRVVNLNLANTTWYIEQLRDNEPKAPIAWTDEQINRLAPVRTAQGIVWVRDLVVQHILRTNRFKRPVYFAVTNPPEIYAPYRKYLEYEGLVYRVVPREGVNAVNAERLEQNLTRECKFDSILTADGKRDRSVYLAPETERLIQNYALAFTQLAYSQHQDRRYENAAANMTLAHEISPHLAPPRQLLGAYLLDAGNTDGALEYYNDALKNDPDDPDLLYGLSRVEEQIGNVERSLDLLDRVMEMAPDSRDVMMTALSIAGTRGLYDRAERYAASWLRNHPNDSEVRRALDDLKSRNTD